MVKPDIYVQPHAPDPVLDERAVLALARRHAAAREVRGIDESGGEARAYMIDDSIVLKVQRPHRLRPRTSLEKEAFFLDRLSLYPEIRVPRLLGYGRAGGVEYLCLTRMPGVAAREVEIEGEERAGLLRALGRLLALIHGIEQAPLRASRLVPGDRSRSDLLERIERGFAVPVTPIEDEPEQDLSWMPSDIASKVIAALPKEPALVALHSNPGPEHVFVDPSTLEFTGLIDFGDAYISHPGFDVRWPRREDRQAIMRGYQEIHRFDPAFLKTWRAALMVADFVTMNSPRFGAERRRHARENLVAELGRPP